MRNKPEKRWQLPAHAAVFLAFINFVVCAFAQSSAPAIVSISPASGGEGTRVEIFGKNLGIVSGVLFGNSVSTFKTLSGKKIVAIVPNHNSTSDIVLVSPAGRFKSAVLFSLRNDPRIPDEVSYKAGYVNPVPPPSHFKSALLWGIAIADTRVPGYGLAQVEIASSRLSCRVDGKDVVLNYDAGKVGGGLYRRDPWFGTDRHEEMPMGNGEGNATLMRVGSRPDKVWHFWSGSPRSTLPEGKLEGCTVTARVKISEGALLQMGMDYWQSATVPYGPGGNNHEAGASGWYFPSPDWQEATFTDIGGVQF